MTSLWGKEWQPDDLRRYVGHLDQIAGISLLEAADGRAHGSRVLDVWTGSGLTFQVLAERALDIGRFAYNGLSLAWQSPTGFPHPAYYEAHAANWLRSFGGGMLATCGLDHFGPPNEDAGQELGQHGRVGNLPASHVGYRTEWVDGAYVLEISGEVRQAAVFAENIVMRRRIRTQLGSNRVQITDRVTNEGFQAQPHMMLYHFNTGFPLVSPESKVRIDSQETTPRDAAAEPGIDTWDQIDAPTHGYAEQVFRHVPRVAGDGTARAELGNPALGITLRITYAAGSLPYLYQWKMMGEGEYVVGLEPSNCATLGGRAAAREAGLLPVLEPGESVDYALELAVITG